MSCELLARRTELMIETQTFSILRDPRAVAGAERIQSPRLQKIFKSAEAQSGIPASLTSAIAYLESWGDATAQSPTGPKGIMQIAGGTASSMGLKIVRATRYRIVTERRLVKPKRGKAVWKTVRRKVPYTVVVRDERLIPEKAVPAAAMYLARMERKFGGRDWAVFGYHCGEGCTAQFRSLVDDAKDLGEEPVSVARMFFGGSPAHNRELHEAVRRHMERDFSPTYWFRIMRASQLLALYGKDEPAFRKLAETYRNWSNPTQRAPHRLAVWLKPEDLTFESCDDLKREQGKKLVRALDNPRKFNFSLRRDIIGIDDLKNQEYYLQASPSAIGTLAYIAFETRRLHDAARPRGETFVPLEVTAMVQPLDYLTRPLKSGFADRDEFNAHCSGQVFDISYSKLPPFQRDCLQFVLRDMGWDGYLGFIESYPGSETYHVGPSPTSRDFFTRIYEEAVGEKGDRS